MTGLRARVAAVVAALASTGAVAALPADWAAMARPDWCTLTPAAAGASLAAAGAAHAANQPRVAGGLAAAVAEGATGAERWAARLLQARAWKVMACDHEATAVLDQVLAADPVPSPLRCLAAARRARLTISVQMDDAARRAADVLHCATAAGPDDAASEALTTQAMVALARSELGAGQQLADQALARAASPLARAEAWRVIGSLRLRRDPDPSQASAAFAQSAAEAEAAGDAEALAIARVSLADVHAGAPEAARWMASALAIAEAGGMRRVLAYAAHQEGQRRLRERTGPSLVAATRLIGTAAALSAALGDVAQERAQRANLASALLLLGDEEGTRREALRAGVLSRQSGLPREAAKAEQLLATLARLADPPRLAEAQQRLTAALATLQAQGDDPSDLALARSEMASLLMALGRPAAAVDELLAALALAERSAPPIDQALLLANLGWAASDAGQDDRALAAWRAALGSAEPQARALAWWGLARQAGQTPLALDRYARAAAEVERMRPGPGQVDPRALGAFDRRFSQLYREHAARLLQEGLAAQAQAVALLIQRQELLEAHWSGSRSAPGDLQPPPPLAPEPLDRCEPVAAAEAQWRAALSAVARLAPGGPAPCCLLPGAAPCPTSAAAAGGGHGDEPARAADCAPQMALLRAETALGRAGNDCLAGLRERLARQEDTTAAFALEQGFERAWFKASAGRSVYLLVTVVDTDRLRLLLRRPGRLGHRIVTVGVTPAELARQMALLRDGLVRAEQLKRQPPTPARQTALARSAQALRDEVLGPLHALLFGAFDPADRPASWPPGSTLALVLDRALRDLPVAALHDGQAYLGERVATVLLTAGATADTRVDGAALSSGAPALVVGVSKPDLPHVRAEVQSVARALQTTPYLDEDGTTARVLGWLQTLQIDRPALALHLAAHATMGGTQASSRVHLWGEPPLTGQDLDQPAIAERLLALRLVVFSACASAASRGDLALGLAGITDRGARSVLGSLWNVDDASTASLMQAFYRVWRDPASPGVAAALARAQAELRQTPGFEHPYFWAAFTVVGRWD